jgi:hypothetical protein
VYSLFGTNMCYVFQVGSVCSAFGQNMCVLLSGLCLCSRLGFSCDLYVESVFLDRCVMNLEGIVSSMSGNVFCIWNEYVSSIRM